MAQVSSPLFTVRGKQCIRNTSWRTTRLAGGHRSSLFYFPICQAQLLACIFSSRLFSYVPNVPHGWCYTDNPLLVWSILLYAKWPRNPITLIGLPPQEFLMSLGPGTIRNLKITNLLFYQLNYQGLLRSEEDFRVFQQPRQFAYLQRIELCPFKVLETWCFLKLRHVCRSIPGCQRKSISWHYAKSKYNVLSLHLIVDR